LATVDGMLNNEVDIATASELVLIGKSLDNVELSTFGIIDKFIHIYLLGRRNHGITDISDLKGKRIGLSLKAASEFYLGRFLELNGMATKDVSLVDVDAVITWQPYVNAIEKRQDNLTKWSVQSAQPAYDLVISTDSWLENHPDLIRRFLASLIEAEKFTVGLPDKARNIIENRLNYDDSYMVDIWQQYEFYVSLDQSLILCMEDEGNVDDK
jgi:NitT/TauT family transport system substrate-binding protein